MNFTDDPYTKIIDKCLNLIPDLQFLKPWKRFDENDIFGVQIPASNRIYFISIVGDENDSNIDIIAYRGASALYGFYEYYMNPNKRDADRLIMPHLLLRLSNRDSTTQYIRDIYKQLGHKFRGKHAWPSFGKVVPGQASTFANESDFKDLFYILNQLIQICTQIRSENDKHLLHNTSHSDETYLIRRAKPGVSPIVFENHYQEIHPEKIQLSITLNEELIKSVNRIPRTPSSVQVDIYMNPRRTQRGSEDIYYLSLMMVNEDKNELIGLKHIAPRPNLETAYAEIPKLMLKVFQQFKIRPEFIKVRNSIMDILSNHVAKKIKVKVVPVESLDILNEHKNKVLR
jgi:hypothetical protein